MHRPHAHAHVEDLSQTLMMDVGSAGADALESFQIPAEYEGQIYRTTDAGFDFGCS